MQPIQEDSDQIDPLEILCKCITRVDVIEGCTDADADVWRIVIDDSDGSQKIIEVSTDQLIQPTKFQQKYLKNFRRPAPWNLKPKWLQFVSRLGEIAQTVEDVENPLKYAVSEAIQKIAQFEITHDPEEAAAGDSYLLVHYGFLCYDSTKMRVLIENITKKIDMASIGKFMVAHKIKHTPKDQRIRIGGFRTSHWWFPPCVFDEYRTEPFVLEVVRK